ncbi:MAG: acid phosphatase type 7, partial [Chloroflexota bacterium]|nr:acid phosphatase type 7 [Chloroflexota bacterium]
MTASRKRRLMVYAALIGLAGVAFGAWDALSGRERAGDGVFLVKPYLQRGSDSAGGLEVLWQGADRDESWALEVKAEAGSRSDGPWVAAGPTTSLRVALEGVEPRRFYRAAVTGQAPGGTFGYRVRRGGVTVFEADARAPRSEAQPHRFVVFGDGGADTWEQRAVAYQAYRARPDFVLMTGDVVYYKGRLADYLTKFFPIYNSDEAAPRSGAPLLRSTLVLAAPGNHDLIERDLDRCPDGLAYFLLWSLPLNGPIETPGAANTPVLRGEARRRKAFLDVAGPAYPRMANYSFDYGGAHWAVLDTNAYADWTDPTLRAWLERDLASDAARAATWRFVAFHQPPFHSSKAHADEQRSRVLVDLLERAAVDLVFCGHIHNYQRTYPLRFAATGAADAEGRVAGRWTLDTAYDGVTRTRPDGIIYVISGAGGARLYSSNHEDDASRQPFTARFIADTHSLTVV